MVGRTAEDLRPAPFLCGSIQTLHTDIAAIAVRQAEHLDDPQQHIRDPAQMKRLHSTQFKGLQVLFPLVEQSGLLVMPQVSLADK